jgi:hypothetical protein
MEPIEPTVNNQILTSATERSLLVPATDRKSNSAELLTVASELSGATQQLLEVMTESELAPEEILDQATQLLSVYDEYLEVLEMEIDSADQSDSVSEEAPQKPMDPPNDLIGLYLVFDYDREVLRTVFGIIEAELLKAAPGKTKTLQGKLGHLGA